MTAVILREAGVPERIVRIGVKPIQSVSSAEKWFNECGLTGSPRTKSNGRIGEE
jgi:hypothetical protein